MLKIVLWYSFLCLALITGACSSNKTVQPQSVQPATSAVPASVSGSSPVSKPDGGGSEDANAALKPAPAPVPMPSTEPIAVDKTKEKPLFPNIPVEHIVVVIEENHSYSQILGNSQAPFLQSLIERGALFTNAHGIAHPSQPNYFALFSGSTQHVKDDSCKGPFTANNLATELEKAKLSFSGYSEDLPAVGFTGCYSNGYARKHNPWAQFANVPEELNRPLSDLPNDYSKLPTVSFVVPALKNDMHDGTVKEADTWLKKHLESYVTWAEKNRSLLIVTWDEDDYGKENHIPVIFLGPMINPGTYQDNINHYHVLRTIEDLYHLQLLGETQKVQALSSIWKS